MTKRCGKFIAQKKIDETRRRKTKKECIYLSERVHETGAERSRGGP